MVDWERNWRGSGIFFVVAFIIGWVIYGSQPKVGSSAGELVSFYDGDRTRILIAATLLAFNVLNLMWFAAALSSVLRDAGKGGWGTAATASSAALGAVLFVLFTLNLGARVLDRRPRQQPDHIRAQRPFVDLDDRCVVPGCDADHVRVVRALAGRNHLERAPSRPA